MANSADPDQLVRSQLIWIYTVCKGRTYLDSIGVGLIAQQGQVEPVSLPNHYFLDRLSPLSGHSVPMHMLSPETDSCLSRLSENNRRKYFTINLHERLLADPAMIG